MLQAMTPELFWALACAFMTSIFWAPHILMRIIEMKPYEAFRDPYHDRPTQAPWAQRAIRAHTNAVENLAVFGILAMSIQILNLTSPATATAAKVYFLARLAHYCVYTLGIPWLRTPVYLTGFAAQTVLAGRLFGWW